jgi:hypothetical protein
MRFFKRKRNAVAALLLALPLAIAADLAPRQPSHDRTWVPEQLRLPRVGIDGDVVRIADVRDFRHRAGAAADQHWFDDQWSAAGVRRIWFALSPFNAKLRALAHPFLSFEFDDGRFLAVSIEARKEPGESYSAVRGLLRRYETIMVIGTEEDLLGQRAVAWGDPLYLFPVRATREQARALFELLMARAQQIEAQPEFYNTVTNNCTTNLIAPINTLTSDDRRIGRRIGLMPGYAYETAYERGWIDTELGLDEARRAFYVNDRVQRAIDAPDFSLAIRSGGAGADPESTR